MVNMSAILAFNQNSIFFPLKREQTDTGAKERIRIRAV